MELQFAPGELVGGRYRIVGLLGQGGMGSVYRADDLRLGVPIALKFLSPALAGDAAALERLRAEVRVARQVSHPNVCRVHDLDAAQGQHFLTMEFVDGEDLASLLGRIGRLSADKALDVARQLAAGLQAAHERGVVHRDLKPANVMLDGRGRVRITDFGLAVSPGEGAGGLAGTPGFLAPELTLGDAASTRSDIYALGLVLYEVFTGRAPFAAANFAEWLRVHREVAPPSPRAFVPELEPRVERAIVACLAKDPAARPSGAGELLQMLPGGDPLAAAVAFGETPAPELVAEAGGGRGLSPREVAWSLAAVAVVASLLLLGSRVNLDAQVPFGPSVEVLSDRARTLLGELGVDAPHDRAAGFAFDSSYLDWEGDPLRGNARWERLAAGQPLVWYFWYRESPAPLEADSVTSGGRVTLEDPPVETPGMSHVVTDVTGRLVEFRAVRPASTAAVAATDQVVDWQPLFRAAGLASADFERAAVERTPPDYADQTFAWRGELAGQGLPIRIEAAAIGGEPVYFRVLGAWERPTGRAIDDRLVVAGAFGFGVLLLVALSAGALVRRNMRSGRGDLRGAARLAAFLGGVAAVASVLQSDLPMTATGFVKSVMQPLNGALFSGAVAWTFYLCVEPSVRRTQPWLLVGWMRLLVGRARDAVVGRELLLGTMLGLCSSGALELGGWLKHWTDHELPPNHFARLESLGTFPSVAAALLSQFEVASLLALGLLAAFVRLDRVLPRPFLAEATLVMLILALAWLGGVQSGPMIAATLLGAAAMVFALVRVGLLAGVVCCLVYNLTVIFPLTVHRDRPQMSLTVASLGTVALITAIASYAALSPSSRRPALVP